MSSFIEKYLLSQRYGAKLSAMYFLALSAASLVVAFVGVKVSPYLGSLAFPVVLGAMILSNVSFICFAIIRFNKNLYK